MQIDGGARIEFESRQEITEILNLIYWLKETHPERVTYNITRLEDVLDVLEMSW